MMGGPDLGGIAAVVCDLDGVVYVGSRPVTGAREALEAIERAGIRLIFATNNSTRTSADTAATITSRVGYAARAEQVVTSALATAMWIRDDVERALVIGEPGLSKTLTDNGIAVVDDPDQAEAVVVGLDRGFDYARLTAASKAVLEGASLYATNMDATFPTPQGLHPGGGAMVAAIETVTGVKAVVCGKPEEPMRRLIRAMVGEGKIAVIGDRPETDIALGIAEGWATVLVLSGVVAGLDQVPDTLRPTAAVATIAGLVALLGID